MPISDIVSVTITSETAGVAQAGFGIPLLLSPNATFPERVRFYTNASSLVAADFQTTDPEYLAASAIFGQSPAPSQIAVGRMALPPTQRYKVSVASVAAGTYEMRVGADDVAVTVAGTFVTNDAIVAALISAVNTLAPAGYTASSAGVVGALYMNITAAAAGTFIAVETYDPAKLTVVQDHADPGVATDLAAIFLEDDTWYCVLNMFNSKLMATAIATWVEANEKLFVCASNETAIITTAEAGATDIAKTFETSAYARTAVLYHPAPDDFADCAWAGRCLPLAPGSETWKFKTLATVAATDLTSTRRTNAVNKSCNYYYTVASLNMTAEGVTSSGEFIDVVRFRDWLKARIAEGIFGRLKNSNKIPFTDAGIAVVEGEIKRVLVEGIDVGGIAETPAPVVAVPKAADVSAANKAARRLTGVTFTCTLAGAIHAVTVTGTVSL